MKITTNSKNNRIETGVLQINDDWPGIFIRGDDSLKYRFMFEHIKKETERLHYEDINLLTFIEKIDLDELIKLFSLL